MEEERYIIIDGEKTRISYFTPEQEEIFASIESEMWESDRASELGDAKREGIKEGRKKGIKEGREQVRKQFKIEVAKKLLKTKTSVKEIAEITELSEEEILKLNK